MKSSWITVLSLLPAIAAGVYAWRADARGRELSGLIADARESEVRARAAADAASSHLEQSAKARALAESSGQAELAGQIALRLQAYRSGQAWGSDGPREP